LIFVYGYIELLKNTEIDENFFCSEPIEENKNDLGLLETPFSANGWGFADLERFSCLSGKISLLHVDLIRL